jgi:twitching motility protein PilT
MTKLYSGGALDSVLKVVVSLGGDRLELKTGQSPAAFVGTRPLRLTLPATSSSMLRALCAEMADVHPQNRDQGESRFSYASADGTRFEVTIRGVLTDQGTASIAVIRAKSLTSDADQASAPSLGSDGRGRDEPSHPAVSHPALSPPAVSPPAVSPPEVPQTRGLLSRSKLEIDPALAEVIAAAIACGASDLHLTQGEPPVFRVQGRLQAVEGPVFDAGWLLSDASQRDRILAGHAVDLAFTFQGTHRLRANVYSARDGVCAALRVLPREAPDLSQLGLPEEVTALTRVRDGLLLFCGLTGAGKSTSLAAITRNLLESSAALCISLESPIEYELSPRRGQSRVRQREVGQHVTSFAAGLRDALREDPDFILIGEIRDRETAALAMTAAETGHLVLSSLHCRGATTAVERIVDLFPADQQGQVRGQLADSLRAVVSQQLLPSKQGDGRVVAVEVLTINAAAAHLIRDGKPEQLRTVTHSGKNAGMLPLERDLARLVKSGRVERSVARSYVRWPELFDQWA